MREPIIITGGPRSGTTLTMRLLHAAGMHLGRTAEATELREGKVRDEVYKPILAQGGFDPLAQDPLPPVGWYPDFITPEQLHKRILELVEVDDFNKPWGFKAIKGVLFWQLLHDAFPDARWVIVERERDEHVKSLLRTPFMTAYSSVEGWNNYLDEIDAHLDDCSCPIIGVDHHVFEPATVRDGDYDQFRRLVQWLDLKWTDQCEMQFDARKYKR